jgi:tetratricopeptide (TPR) repeat protein
MRNKLLKYIKKNWFLSLVIIVTFLVYSKSLFYPAISWDDPEMIFKNKAVKDFDLKTLFNSHYVGNYIPVTMLFHAIAWFIFEEWAGGHHLFSVIFHLVNILLVYQITNHILKNKTYSFITIILFALHPLQIESIAWASEFKTILSATFFLASIRQFVNYIDEQKQKHYIYCLILFLLACLSKPSAVVLPFILILFELILNKSFLFSKLLKYLPFFFVSALMAYVTIQTQTADQFINHSHEFSYMTRIAMAGFALFNYLILFFLPIQQSVIYSYPATNMSNQLIGGFVLISFLFLIFYFVKYKKVKEVMALLFFLINLLLVLQFLPFGEALFADRYMYLAIIGLAWAMAFIFEKFRLNKPAILTTLLLICASFSFGRLNVWQNSLSLYEDVIKKYPTQFVALNSAGVECMLLNEHQKSLSYFQKAIKAAPNNYKGYYNLGLLYLKNNQAELSIDCFNRAINLYEYYKAYTARASAYYMLKDLPKAMNDVKKVLTLDKNNSKAYFILGNCYNDLNNLDEALKAYNQAIKNNGEESDYYFKRAIVLGKKQQFIDCNNDLIVCLELNPKNFEAHYWKGVSLVNLKKNPCKDFKIAAQNNFEPAVNAYNKYCR